MTPAELINEFSPHIRAATHILTQLSTNYWDHTSEQRAEDLAAAAEHFRVAIEIVKEWEHEQQNR